MGPKPVLWLPIGQLSGLFIMGFWTGVQCPTTPSYLVSLKTCFMFNLLVVRWSLNRISQQCYNFWLARNFVDLIYKLSLLKLFQCSAFLLAVVCGRGCSEMHALSILPHMRFSREGVILLPRAVYLLKNQSLEFNPEPIFLSGNREDAPWCPVRCLKFYLDRTKERRGSIDQLFITALGQQNPISKQHSVTGSLRWCVAPLSSWVSQGPKCEPMILEVSPHPGHYTQVSHWQLQDGVLRPLFSIHICVMYLLSGNSEMHARLSQHCVHDCFSPCYNVHY